MVKEKHFEGKTSEKIRDVLFQVDEEMRALAKKANFSVGLKLWSMNISSDSGFLTKEELLRDGTDYNSPSAIFIRKVPAEKGYDGIIYSNGFVGNGKSYIAFENEQIIVTD